jgi:hypothetical protein
VNSRILAERTLLRPSSFVCQPSSSVYQATIDALNEMDSCVATSCGPKN